MRRLYNLLYLVPVYGLAVSSGCSPSQQSSMPTSNKAATVATPQATLTSLDAQRNYMAELVKRVDGKDKKEPSLMYYLRDSTTTWNLVIGRRCNDEILKTLSANQVYVYRKAANLMSTISPVPESFRGVDEQISNAGSEFGKCANLLDKWRNETNLDEATALGEQALAHDKKGEELLQSGLDDAKRIMNESSKTYTKN